MHPTPIMGCVCFCVCALSPRPPGPHRREESKGVQVVHSLRLLGSLPGVGALTSSCPNQVGTLLLVS